MYKRQPSGVAPVLGSDLNIGDRIPVARKIPTVPNPITIKTLGTEIYNLDKELGWVIGAYLSTGVDGNTKSSKMKWLYQAIGTDYYNKYVPAWVFQGNLEFMEGIVAGFFDGDNGDVTEMIRAQSNSERIVDDMIVLLAYCGIYACKTKEIKKHNSVYVIQICRKYSQPVSYTHLTLPTNREV